MESHKINEDNDEDSKKTDWAMIFILFRSRGFSDEEIAQLSYPKFKIYMENMNNPLFFPLVIPYLGGGEKEGKDINDGNKVKSPEELLSIVANMNSDFN